MKNNIKVVQFGVPRTGSTLVCQIMDNVLPVKVVKEHDFIKADKIICTYRDFRDVVISNWRVQSNPPPGRSINRPEIDLNAGYILKCISNLNSYRDRCPNKCKFLKYEDFKENYKLIFDTIENFFSISISAEKRAELKKEFSFKKNKDRSLKFKTFHERCPKTRIHGLHLYKGEIGTWKEFTKPKDHNYLLNLLKGPLKEWKYVK